MRTLSGTATLLLFMGTIEVSSGLNFQAVMLVGGKGRKDVEFRSITPQLPDPFPQIPGNCSNFADAPFITQSSIGLKDSLGRPMVCGGNRNPNQKSCIIYDLLSNSWIPGPSMKRKRAGASVTCLPNGVCWVFGGRSKSTTEYYDPTTNKFEFGPGMPVNSTHGLCTVLHPTGYIYMAARRQAGMTRLFKFDPSPGAPAFDPNELASLNYERRYMSCGISSFSINIPIVGVTEERNEFILAGGADENNQPTDTSFVYDIDSDSWSQMDNDFPYPMLGATQVQLGFSPLSSHFVFGGEMAGQVDASQGSLFSPYSIGERVINVFGNTIRIPTLDDDSTWVNFPGTIPGYPAPAPRSYAVAIPVPNICPGA